MKNLFAMVKANISHKILFGLFLGLSPIITNCSQAKYGETNKQAPLPGLAVPAVAAPAAKLPGAKTIPTGTIKDIDGGTAKESTPELSSSGRKSTSGPIETLRNNDRQLPIVIGNVAPKPCPQQCVGTPVTTVRALPQQVAPIQNVPCKGGSCHKSPFVQSYVSPTQNVDILFVVDSNVSLSDQRFALFQNIDSFLNNLPSNLNYHMAVLNTQDLQSSLYAVPSKPEQVILADLSSLNADDRAKSIEAAKQGIWDRIATLNTVNFVGTSENILKMFERAISSPELEKNQAKGFFRSDAGLVVVSLTDERVSNQVLHPLCIDLAKRIYEKIVALKSLGIKYHVLQTLPIEFIGFAYLDSDEMMNQGRKVPFSSDMLELLHLADGVLFDLAKAAANIEQMKADLRFAGDQVFRMWMKKRFLIKPDIAMDPKSVCFVANGQLIPTNFVPELNEMRIDPKAMRLLESSALSGLSTDVLWCENGEVNNNSRLNEYRINPTCIDLLSKFR